MPFFIAFEPHDLFIYSIGDLESAHSMEKIPQKLLTKLARFLPKKWHFNWRNDCQSFYHYSQKLWATFTSWSSSDQKWSAITIRSPYLCHRYIYSLLTILTFIDCIGQTTCICIYSGESRVLNISIIVVYCLRTIIPI